ncbi:MAG: ABC transporter substrate-binding protein [Parafannyhessea umbonata]|uniref:ABC transporter substrate-binding protein n=1 Tax=Parafannyhessea umbonata TaxID=604330 RepID=UPI0026EB2601|nr:ABC transporter substrate-binding protein [Parafannyhessea umbonata]MDD6566574.1 ABC transporter substrate-binding protein [Parafannyhessea umbonata]
MHTGSRLASRQITRREALRAMGMCACALGLAGCGSGALSQAAHQGSDKGGSDKAEKSGGTIRIGFPSSGQNFDAGTPLGFADSRGYLSKELDSLGYSVKTTGFVGAAPALHEALIAGDLDLVDYAGFAAILGRSKGIDITTIAVTAWGSSWDIAAAPGISSIANLKGKKVAYQRGATPQMFLIKALAEAGLAFDDVEGVNSTGPDGLSSLATGAVDATVCTSGQEADLVSNGKAKVLFRGIDGDQKTFYEPFTLVARTDWLKKNGDAATAILKGYLAARDKMAADPQAFVSYAASKSGLSKEVVRGGKSLDDFGSYFPVSLDDVYLSSLEKIQQFELENKLIDKTTDISSWTDSSYLDKAVAAYGSGR